MISGNSSLDTSVVLRLLVGEPADQYQLAARFLRDQVTAKRAVHVGDLVLAEAYFALQKFYLLPKKEALESLTLFVRHGGVTVTAVAGAVMALPNLAKAKPGFVDRLIHGRSQGDGQTLVTFEKAGQKLPGTFVLGPLKNTP